MFQMPINRLILFFCAVLCAFFFGFYYQQANIEPTCCHVQFATFGSDAQFKAQHQTPKKLWREDSLGRTETFVTPDGKTASAYWVRNPRSEKFLFVFHEWWGLNEHIKQMADNFANELMINVIALDLYDGKIASTPQEAANLMQANKIERSQAIIKGALNLTDTKAKIATVGWCFGGGWSLQAAMLAGKKATACIMYYGMPETDVRKLKTLKCDVLNIVALKDQWITPQITTQFEANMKASGKNLTIKAYDADHAFANPSNPNHNADFAADAFALSLKFIKDRW